MQLFIFALTYLNYGILHATRSAWSLASKDVTQEYGFTLDQISYMNSVFLGFYSLGGFYLSSLGDKYNKNRLIFVMYTLIALTQSYLGFLGHTTTHKSAWPFYIEKVMDGTFQSFAWAVNFAILCNWFPRKGRGLLIGVWATNPSVGDIFGQQLFIGMAGNSIDKWNRCFYVLAMVVFCVGVLNLVLLREYPAQCDLQIREQGELLDPTKLRIRDEDLLNEDAEEIQEDGEEVPSMPFCEAIRIWGVLQFAVSFFFIKFAFYGVYYWVPSYL